MLFKSIEKKTNSVVKSLLEFSKNNNVDIKSIDFDLFSFETSLKNKETDALSIVEKVTLAQLKDPKLEIIQTYQIRITPYLKHEKKVSLALSTNKSKTKAALTIKKGSIFTNTPSLLKDLKDEIWKKMLRAGYFINIFEENLDKQLNKLLKILTYDKPLSKDLKFTVASALMPEEPIDGKIHKVYEKKSVESKSIITGIDKGELVAVYTLPVNGTIGRSCNGTYIAPKEASIVDKQPYCDETINEQAFSDRIEYYANVDGYPLLQKDQLSISNNLQLKEATFKSTANIDAGNQNRDIAVNINHEKSHNEDAIGSGVKIDVKELNVDGSVASNVSIATQNLQIDAQTHKNSKIQVTDTAKIKLHRGDLNTKEAEIDILESGKITASKSANIRQTLGGVIIAPVVYIHEMISNTTVIASELIEIKSITGENNKLIIDPDAIASNHEDILKLKEQLETHSKELQEKREDLQRKIQEHTSQLDRIKTFQKRVLQATKDGKSPMKQDVIRVKQYKKDSQKYQVQKEDLENDKTLENLEKQLNKLCSMDLHAKITSKTLYDGHTKVTFINPETNEETSFMPEGSIPTISLKLDSDNNRVISTDEES